MMTETVIRDMQRKVRTFRDIVTRLDGDFAGRPDLHVRVLDELHLYKQLLEMPAPDLTIDTLRRRSSIYLK